MMAISGTGMKLGEQNFQISSARKIFWPRILRDKIQTISQHFSNAVCDAGVPAMSLPGKRNVGLMMTQPVGTAAKISAAVVAARRLNRSAYSPDGSKINRQVKSPLI